MNVTHLSISNLYNLQPLALGSTSYILYSSTDLLMNQKSMRQYCIPFYCIRYRVFQRLIGSRQVRTCFTHKKNYILQTQRVKSPASRKVRLHYSHNFIVQNLSSVISISIVYIIFRLNIHILKFHMVFVALMKNIRISIMYFNYLDREVKIQIIKRVENIFMLCLF